VATILVLDDEPCVMQIMRLVLKQHFIVEATRAEEAIRMFHENAGRIDLLIADLTLPASSGLAVALCLQEEKPGLPVILTSGYPLSGWSIRDTRDLQKLEKGSFVILPKPFDFPLLRQSVRELTGERAVGMA
jgi:DNA-binding NtrC family response regulator